MYKKFQQFIKEDDIFFRDKKDPEFYSQIIFDKKSTPSEIEISNPDKTIGWFVAIYKKYIEKYKDFSILNQINPKILIPEFQLDLFNKIKTYNDATILCKNIIKTDHNYTRFYTHPEIILKTKKNDKIKILFFITLLHHRAAQKTEIQELTVQLFSLNLFLYHTEVQQQLTNFYRNIYKHSTNDPVESFSNYIISILNEKNIEKILKNNPEMSLFIFKNVNLIEYIIDGLDIPIDMWSKETYKHIIHNPFSLIKLLKNKIITENQILTNKILYTLIVQITKNIDKDHYHAFFRELLKEHFYFILQLTEIEVMRPKEIELILNLLSSDEYNENLLFVIQNVKEKSYIVSHFLINDMKKSTFNFNPILIAALTNPHIDLHIKNVILRELLPYKPEIILDFENAKKTFQLKMFRNYRITTQVKYIDFIEQYIGPEERELVRDQINYLDL